MTKQRIQALLICSLILLGESAIAQSPAGEIAISGSGYSVLRIPPSAGAQRVAVSWAGSMDRADAAAILVWYFDAISLDPVDGGFFSVRQGVISAGETARFHRFSVLAEACVTSRWSSCTFAGGIDIPALPNGTLVLVEWGLKQPAALRFDGVGIDVQQMASGPAVFATERDFTGQYAYAEMGGPRVLAYWNGSRTLVQSHGFVGWFGSDPGVGTLKSTSFPPGSEPNVAANQYLRSEVPGTYRFQIDGVSLGGRAFLLGADLTLSTFL